MPALNLTAQSLGRYIIGSFQAKTYFAEVLRTVEAGNTVVITRNGHDVAVMQSPARAKNAKALEAWKRLSSIAKELSEQKGANKVSTKDIEEWKLDGRK